MAPKKVYWDTSCFISYLSGTRPEEVARSLICEDILKHARNDEVEIWTSVYTIVETIRPKSAYQPSPAPLWAELLNTKDKDGKILHPEAASEFDKIWNYYKKSTLPTRLLAEDQALRIKQMFDWSWIRKIQVIPVIAHKAAEIARAHNMKPGDSVHVASALHRNCEVIHRWDRDYARTDSLIPSQDPLRMAPQNLLDLT
jgi:predicted nucleic acid-binding protein